MTTVRWIVLLREVSGTVTVQGEAVLHACLVLDEAGGLALGARIYPDAARALDAALSTARDAPPSPLTPGLPHVLWCAPDAAEPVAAAARRLAKGRNRRLEVQAAPVPEWADDAFDSLVSHLSGREHPDKLAAGARPLPRGVATRRHR